MEHIDRDTGRVVTERVVRGGLFDWLYNTDSGRVLSPLFVRGRLLHALVGAFADSAWSRPLIPGFARAAGVSLEEAAEPLESYRTLNAFFTRRLAPGCRPIDADPEVLVSPGDGKLWVVPELADGTTLPVKGRAVSVRALLADDALAARYERGSAAVLRLYLGDYHRLHFPADGVPARPRPVRGEYWSVSPFPGNDIDFYVRNVRSVTPFQTARFGAMCFVDVGGFLISGIGTSFTPGLPVRKGQEKGWFAFGGSTLILLAEHGAVNWDADLRANSAAGRETRVRLGTRIGSSVKGGEHG